MPEIGELEYLVSFLFEIGEAERSDGCLKTVSWSTIKAWAEVTGMQLTPREALAIRSLSKAYVDQYYLSENPACMSPIIECQPSADVVSDKLKAMFALLRKN